jgi:hypothetical protein
VYKNRCQELTCDGRTHNGLWLDCYRQYVYHRRDNFHLLIIMSYLEVDDNMMNQTPHVPSSGIPIEILLTILEAAYFDDRGSPDVDLLSKCTLVCKAWSLHAQKPPFRRVRSLTAIDGPTSICLAKRSSYVSRTAWSLRPLQGVLLIFVAFGTVMNYAISG